MNRLEELLIIASEECAELTVAASKVLRFGDEEKNLERLQNECSDVIALVMLIQEYFGWSDGDMKNGVERKIEKLKKYSGLFSDD